MRYQKMLSVGLVVFLVMSGLVGTMGSSMKDTSGMRETEEINEGGDDDPREVKPTSETEEVKSLADSPWPMFGHDVKHASVSHYNTTHVDGTKKLSFSTGGAVSSSPAVGSNATIYVGSNDNRLYAINPDGTEEWSFSTGGDVVSSSALGSDGTIYVGSSDYNLYAINPDGTERWNFSTDDSSGWDGIVSSPAIDNNGTIYFGSDDYKLYAVNPDGSERWHFTTAYPVRSSPAIGDDGTIYFGSNDGYFYALYPNGTEKWNFRTEASIETSSPALDSNGNIYFSTIYERIYCLNSDGKEKWHSQIGSGNAGSSPSIGKDGTVYIGSSNNKLYAFNSDGTEKWNFSTGGNVCSSPTIGSEGTIYTGSDDYNLYAINPDGSEKWNFSTGGAVSSSVAVGGDGTIYVGSNDYNLYSFTGSDNINLTAHGDGWNFVSTEYIPATRSLVDILNDTDHGIEGSYDKLMYYEASTDTWRTYKVDRASHYNDLESWDRTMGIWIHMTHDATLTITGYPPEITNITLEPGWNMVGYPSKTDLVAEKTLPAEVTKIGVFDDSQEYNIKYIYDLGNYTMKPNEGYWVYNRADYAVEWSVEY